MAIRVLLLGLAAVRVQATCTTDEDFKLSGPSLKTVAATSYGACCDACIQSTSCSYWSWSAPSVCELKASDAGRTASKGSWSGWAGTGPAPPPPVAPGKWSMVHNSVSCEQSPSSFVKEMGNIPLAACQAACVAEPKCGYICHADQTNHDCKLYGSCSEPALCGHTGWDTYQYGRPNAPAWNTTCKNAAPPGPPPPAPPSSPDSFECQVRLLALEFAAEILGPGANVSAVAHSMALDQPGGCKPPAGVGGSLELAHTLPPLPADATAIYVDAAKGSDTNTGTLSSPLKTLAAAQKHGRGASAGSSYTVFVRAGTYFLTESLKLGPQDHGATFAAYQNEKVVLSGGVDLSGLKWTQPAGKAYFETPLPASAHGLEVNTLFVNGRREIRAKFPNGDPLLPGAAGGYSANAAGALGTFAATGVLFPPLVTVKDASGKLLSNGGSADGKKYTFTVSPEAVPVMTGRGYNPTRQDFNAYFNGSAERFNTTWNNPFWNSQVSPGFKTNSLTGTPSWANPSTGIVHMYHSGGWGGWQYQVDARPSPTEIVFACRQLSDGKRVTCPTTLDGDADAADLVIDGGFQECRGAGIGNNQFYVENIEELQDDPREWFLKTDGAGAPSLRYIPPAGVNINDPSTAVVGAVLKRVIEIEGATGVTLRGLTITATAPTFLDSYECPSGGDWSIHRGAAVFVEASSNITIEGLTFDQDVGDSAISMLGSTQQMIGTTGKGLFPSHNLIESNVVDVVGVYGKQTSAYFKAKSRANTVRKNVFMNGPRAGVNFNDGTAGGEVLEMNLVMNFVRESGDHGMFNSWDRQPIVHDDEAGRVALNPATHQLRKNFIFNKNWLGSTNSGYSVDYDDGSSQYNATENFLVFGAFKVRDGINRAHSHNIIYGKPADYQCDGFNSTSMEYNTIIGVNGGAVEYGCVGQAFGAQGSYNSVKQNFNKYYGSGLNACGKSFSQLQAAGYDTSSTLSPNISVPEIMNMAKTMLFAP